MHLERAYLTTTRVNNKQKLSAKAAKAQLKHDKWLRKQGLHPEQLAIKKEANKKEKAKNCDPIISTTMSSLASNQIPGNAPVRSIFNSEWQRTYEDDEMMEREKASLIDSHAKAKRLAPAYNKGAIQFVTDGASSVE